MSTKLIQPKDEYYEIYEEDVLVHPEEGIEELAKRLPSDCDFFKEIIDLYKPFAEEKTEEFRQEWLEEYEAGEIFVDHYWKDEDGSKYDSDEDGWNMNEPHSINRYCQNIMDKVYEEVFPRCALIPITDVHREFVVMCHARQIITSEALCRMIYEFNEFNFLRQFIDHSLIEKNDMNDNLFEIGNELSNLFKVWKSAFSYLRPSHSRFPMEKYGVIWEEAMIAYDKSRMAEFKSTEDSIIIGLSQAVKQAQNHINDVDSDIDFSKRVQTLVTASNALHKILSEREDV